MKPAWDAAARMLSDLGCVGSASFALWGLSPRHNPNQGRAVVFVRRWTTVAAPTDDEIASIDRELQREAGFMAWEPEPPAESESADDGIRPE